MNKIRIKDFENYYLTSDARVLNGDRPVKIQFTTKGIPFVRLRKDGEYITITMSRLAAINYLGEPTNPSDVVGYKDGNNHNFTKNNIYWTTRSERYSKLYRENSRYAETRIKNLRNKICKPVMSYKRMSQGLIEVKSYDSITDAAKDVGVGPASIMRCLKNENNSCMGLAWRYINKED